MIIIKHVQTKKYIRGAYGDDDGHIFPVFGEHADTARRFESLEAAKEFLDAIEHIGRASYDLIVCRG